MQISENGAISFGSPLSTPPQTPGPSLLQDAAEIFLVAPFWTDYTLEAGGSVRYEVYSSPNSDTAQEDVLASISRFLVNRTSGLEVFDASWMMLVEWEDSQPFLTQANLNANPNSSSVREVLLVA